MAEELREIVCTLVESALERNDYEDAEQAWKCLSWLIKFDITISMEDVILLANLRIVNGTYMTISYYIQ